MNSDRLEGKFDEMLGKLQEKTGKKKEESIDEVKHWPPHTSTELFQGLKTPSQFGFFMGTFDKR